MLRNILKKNQQIEFQLYFICFQKMILYYLYIFNCQNYYSFEFNELKLLNCLQRPNKIHFFILLTQNFEIQKQSNIQMNDMNLFGFGQDTQQDINQIKNKYTHRYQKNLNEGEQGGLKKLPIKIKKAFQISENQKLDEEDQDFVYRVLIQIFKYPDKQLAQLHRMSNRLGKKDLKLQKQKQKQKKNEKQISIKNNQISQDNIQVTEQSLNDNALQTQNQKLKNNQQQFCNCCGFTKQTQQISSCVKFEQFPTIGLSPYLFFRSICNVAILLALLFFIFGLFSVYINFEVQFRSEGRDLASGFDLIPGNFYTIFSYRSMEANMIVPGSNVSTFTLVNSILILIIVVVWSFLVYLFKHYENQHKQLIDDNSATASDFAVMIQNAPKQLFSDFKFIQKQFQQYFLQVFKTIKTQYFDIYLKKKQNRKTFSYQKQLKKLKLIKINIGIPFYLNQTVQDDRQYNQLQQQLQQHKHWLTQWITQFFENKKLSVKAQRRQKRLAQFVAVEETLKRKKQQFQDRLQKQYKTQTSQQLTTTVFLTFDSAIAAKIVYELNPSDFLSKVRYVLACCSNRNFINLKNKQGQIVPLKISRAPQPEDIIWENIGVSACKIFVRRMMTYVVTTSILAGSFFLFSYLSDIQIHTDDNLISIAISVAITLLNMGIGQIIMILTAFQMDFTQSNHQASLALKSIVAQLINSVAIPVWIKRDNIYGEKGLVQDVFFLAFTTALFGPILKYFDVFYLYSRLVYRYKSRPYQRIGIDQDQLNQIAQLLQFQVGFQYIYVADIFLISCFYAYLQPIIPLISLIGLFLMYWVSKYCLLNRSKRPIPGDDTINITVGQIVNLGPIVLAAGTIMFSDILTDHPDRNLKFLLHLITAGIGLFFYLLPFQTIYRVMFSQDELFYNLDYFQSRVVLPSEYDRLNPATSQQAMIDFKNYLKDLNNYLNKNDGNNEDQAQHQKKILNNIESMFKKQKKNPKRKTAFKMLRVQGFGSDLFDQTLNDRKKDKAIKGQQYLRQMYKPHKKQQNAQKQSDSFGKQKHLQPAFKKNQSSILFLQQQGNQNPNSQKQVKKVSKQQLSNQYKKPVAQAKKQVKSPISNQPIIVKKKQQNIFDNQQSIGDQESSKKKTYAFQSQQKNNHHSQKFNLSKLKVNRIDNQTPTQKKQQNNGISNHKSNQIKTVQNNNQHESRNNKSQSKLIENNESNGKSNNSIYEKPTNDKNSQIPNNKLQIKPNKLFSKKVQILGFGNTEQQKTDQKQGTNNNSNNKGYGIDYQNQRRNNVKFNPYSNR